VRQGDRDKAYRPLTPEDRRTALQAALAAWARDDWFETHELLEPAWMGTEDRLERDLYQGLIKLAAAYVHRARGNGLGMAKNLAGAHARLRRVAEQRDAMAGVGVRRLLADVAGRMPASGQPADLTIGPPLLSTPEDH
jgi:predicted metal-dependent hydrolase